MTGTEGGSGEVDEVRLRIVTEGGLGEERRAERMIEPMEPVAPMRSTLRLGAWEDMVVTEFGSGIRIEVRWV